jgi:hypothetical protein
MYLFEWMRQSVQDFFLSLVNICIATGGPVNKWGVESLDAINRFNPTTFCVHVPS